MKEKRKIRHSLDKYFDENHNIKNKEQKEETSNKEETVQLKVHIPKSLNDELRKLINQKYESYEKGLLSYEVTQALAYWIAQHHKSAQTHVVNPSPRVFKVAREVGNVIVKKYGFVPQQVLRADIEEAIIEVRGGDPRTIRKWFRLFEKFGLIKHIAGEVWENLLT